WTGGLRKGLADGEGVEVEVGEQGAVVVYGGRRQLGAGGDEVADHLQRRGGGPRPGVCAILGWVARPRIRTDPVPQLRQRRELTRVHQENGRVLEVERPGEAGGEQGRRG